MSCTTWEQTSGIRTGRQIQNHGQLAPVTNGLSTTFTFPHNLGREPEYISITPKNMRTAAPYHLSSDDTNITITFLTAPLIGGLDFYWAAM